MRTNSESIGGVTARDPETDYRGSIVLTGSLFPNETTHIEYATYGDAGDTTAMQLAPLTGPGGRLLRPLKLTGAIARGPRDFLRTLWPRGRSRRTIFTVAMQELDNAVRLIARPRRLGRGVRLQTRQDPEQPIPTYIPELNEFTAALAERVDGVPQSWFTEAVAGIPITAHVLGGAVVGRSPAEGVIDGRHRVYGYENLLVCDGSAVPANPGVNPSLMIAAMSERVMSLVVR